MVMVPPMVMGPELAVSSSARVTSPAINSVPAPALSSPDVTVRLPSIWATDAVRLKPAAPA